MRVTATVRYEVREEPADARSSIRHVRGVMIAGSGRWPGCVSRADACAESPILWIRE
jgi:hypothetical protein